MQKTIIVKNIISLFLFAILLSACGTPHVRTDKSTADLHDYKNIFIDEVDVHSQEKSAKTNMALQSKLIEWERFARRELESYVEKSHYRLVESANEGSWGTLVVNLDIDLEYGNRAFRYWLGFGAGKGSVDSVLTVIDPITRDEKLHAVAESDLAIGGFGGDMENVLKKNIKLLVQQFPPAPPKLEAGITANPATSQLSAPTTSQLRAIDSKEKGECEFIKSITRSAGGTGNTSGYVKSATDSAMAEAANNGADSYYLVSADTTGSGASVVLEAFRCK